MFENLRQDIAQARRVNVGPSWFGQHVQVFAQINFLPVFTYRLVRWVWKLRIPVVRHLLLIPVLLLRQFSEILTGVRISASADIGPGLALHHVEGIYVGRREIGRNCVICTGVLISNGKRSIGDDVFLGAGAKVMDTACIGDNVIVGPNSVVIADVPDNVTVIGVPARLQIPGGNYTAQLVRPQSRTHPQSAHYKEYLGKAVTTKGQE